MFHCGVDELIQLFPGKELIVVHTILKSRKPKMGTGGSSAVR